MSAEVAAPSRIDSVLVFPAGAEIVRTAKVRIEQGEHIVVVNDLPAQAIASSIRVEGRSTGRLEIGSVDVRVVAVPRDDAQNVATERRRIELEIERAKDERAALQAIVQGAEAQKALLANLTQLPTHTPPAGASGPREDWGQLFGLIGTRFGEAQRVILETGVKIRDVERRIADLERSLGQFAPSTVQRTEARVNVAAAAPLEATFLVRYQVSSASWQPLYDARLATGAKAVAPKLQLVRRATIQQRSGEDWDGVTLSLSTTRPTGGTAAPDTHTVTVDFEPDAPPPRPMAAPAPATRSMPMREEAARPAAAPPIADAAPKIAEERQATVVAAPFQAVYGVPGKLTVKATGEIKRVQIGTDELEPQLMIRSVPRQDTNAYLYVKAQLAKGTPILPGQVALFRDGTFVGNGRLPLLAPGEDHELGFGVDDAVRIKHVIVGEQRGERGLITSSKTDERNYKITVKNLHERAIPVMVFDAAPVSQNADIKVELTTKPAPTKRDVDDKRGVLAWELKVDPDEEKVIELGWRVTWPAAKRLMYGR